MNADASTSAMPPSLALDAGSMCTRPVITIGESETIAAAARLMREQHVGYLVVTAPPSESGARKVVGVLTDRDIVVAVVAREADPRSLKVGEVMTRSPLLVGENHSLDAVLRFMREVGVRRVPVTSAHGDLVGVLSLDDVLERVAEQLTNIVSSIRAAQSIERMVRP